jgi:hypothetical protein
LLFRKLATLHSVAGFTGLCAPAFRGVPLADARGASGEVQLWDVRAHSPRQGPTLTSRRARLTSSRGAVRMLDAPPRAPLTPIAWRFRWMSDAG